ncbi:hypothetical protein EOL70_12935 [Leucothrix sargassi]|nr:hypothetical protein EOL70_12935 [Leucothrix sargassi]
MTNNQNKVYKRASSLSIPLLISLGLIACNSSSSSDDSSANQNVLTGKISGIAIEGLSYQTNTQSGTTTSDGSFSYKDGELVTFFVGDITVGQSVTAAAEVTLFDLVGISDPSAVTTAVETKYRSKSNYSTRANSRFDYERLGNLAVLLSTVDEDRDLSNGVVVATGLDAVATDTSLDIMTLQSNAFSKRIQDSDLISNKVTPTGRALDELYAGIGITPQLSVTSNERIITDGDESDPLNVSYAFDLESNSITRTRTLDLSGDAYTYTFDKADNLIDLRIDTDNDGNDDYIEAWVYDDQGTLRLHQVDTDGNGTIESQRMTEVEYHDNQQLSSKTNTFETFSEYTGERTSYYSDTTHVDTNNEVTYEAYESQAGSDSQRYAYSTTYIRNDNGDPTTITKDTDGDGSPDEIYTHQYDAEGREILAESDTDADGIIDSSIGTSYERIGNQLTIISGNDTSIVTYDEHDKIIRTLVDIDSDGSYETDIASVITYDDEGRILTKDNTSPTTTDENYQYSISYSESGETLTEQQTFTHHPERNLLYTAVLDDEGNITSSISESGSIDAGQYYKSTIALNDDFGGETRTEYRYNDGIEQESASSSHYNDLGYLASQTRSANTLQNYSETWDYNEDAQLTHYSLTISDEFAESRELAYDEMGERESAIYEQTLSNEYLKTVTYESTNITSWQLLFLKVDSME